MKDVAISIIVPVYQVAPYLRECLDSILAQTFEDWEMLLVDDGSTDGSEKICDEYGTRDVRIRVFHQEHRGPSAARNKALDHAMGLYYTMVDSDDVLVSPDYLKILYDVLLQNDADMSVCGHIWFLDGASVPEAIDMHEGPEICTGRDFYISRGIKRKQKFLDKQGNTLFRGYAYIGAHGKLYKRELFTRLRFPEGRILEDLATLHRVYYQSDRVALAGIYMYAYRNGRTGSIMTSSDKSILHRDLIYAYSDQVSFFLDIGDMYMAAMIGVKLQRLLKNQSDRRI